MDSNQPYTGLEIAIIGMACRFPGAANWREYWHNLENGVESIRPLSDEELLKAGLDRTMLADKDLIRAGIDLPRKELFDSSFFNYRPDDAILLNPSHRAFHECVWEALEDAGCDPDRVNGHIGLYAGAGDDLNWKLYSILKNANRRTDEFTLTQINNKDNLATLLSYKLNLKGPSLSVNTACSTSLVAVHLACKSLLLGETRMALAGGVTILAQKQKGHFYREGMILSSDGHCRAFDKDAGGTVASEGAGVVVLKRLKNAIADGDHIYAVIKGSAINNDGNRKVGYTAPSVDGQSECIKMAHKLSRIDPGDIGYIEAHGTGTKLGDPVEIEALNIAFVNNQQKHAVIGAAKTNIGHLDTAAGIAGLIKTALCLKFRRIPATLHFKESNPDADFKGGPFYINNELKEWEKKGDSPLRAGVSSFGIGGTNAHVVMEEAPGKEESGPGRPFKIMVVSAKTERSLDRYIHNLVDHVRTSPEVNLPDMAYMLQVGRKHFEYRKYAVFGNRDDLLSLPDRGILSEKATKSKIRDELIFMFPGQGSQYVNMGIGLYENEVLFREWMDKGFMALRELTGVNFKNILFPENDEPGRLQETRYAQPLIFLFEYSLARLIMSLGVTPRYMIGHSIGEYAAACISGVFSFGDALKLVVRRGELINNLAHGVMISAALPLRQAGGYSADGVCVAAINSPGQVVFSGNMDAMTGLMHKLDESDVSYIKLHTSHAFHSEMLEPILEDFREVLEGLSFGNVKIPFVSNLTGDLIREQDAVSPGYWVRHMREAVKFSDGIQSLLSRSSDPLFIETGAGHSLASLVKQHRSGEAKISAIDLVKRPGGRSGDPAYFAEGIGRLWSLGVNIDWTEYNRSENRNKVSLPTYSFESIRYPVEVDPAEAGMSFDKGLAGLSKGRELKDWIYYPVWKNVVLLPPEAAAVHRSYLVFSFDARFTGSMKPCLVNEGDEFIEVTIGSSYRRTSKYEYIIDPCCAEDYETLAKSILEDKVAITDIIYSWTIGVDSVPLGSKTPGLEINLVYFGLVNVVKALLHTGQISGKRIMVMTDRLYKVIGSEDLRHAASLILGLMNSLPQEYSVKCFNVDIDLGGSDSELPEKIARDIKGNISDRVVAIRNGIRWVRDYQQNPLPLVKKEGALRRGGTYLITGGSGNVGTVLTKYLVEQYQAKVAVTGRREYSHLNKIPGVFYYSVDVADIYEFRQRVEEIEGALGPIAGVIHAAGITDHRYFELVEDITIERSLAIFSPKVNGIRNIYEIFKHRSLDFVWATSSLASVLGGLTYASYASANLYMDHFISSLPRGFNWKSIQLSEMLFHEESIKKERNEDRTALKPQEICQLFEWSLGVKEHCVIVETVENLFARIRRAYEEKRDRYLDTDLSADAVEKIDRPDLKTTYIAAGTDTEKKIVEMLEDFFGIRGIGVEDNFFELGGDSLKATVFLRRLEQAFLIKMSMADFFLADHIRKIADEIDEKLWLHKQSGNHVVSVI